VRTWVHALFEGTLTNRTVCLWCDAASSREEPFLDLSLDLPAATLAACLKGFSAVETMGGEEKYECDACCGKQEAQKRLLVQQAPPVLALHLKRFKYFEASGRHKKLSHKVEFPHLLRLGGCCASAAVGRQRYSLFAAVVHVGSGPNHGHYICLVRAGASWVCFDDDEVRRVEAEALSAYCGAGPPAEEEEAARDALGSLGGGGALGLRPPPSTSDAYILFYQREEKEEEEEGGAEAEG